MGKYENIVRQIVEPLVQNKDALLIREVDRPEENSLTVVVYGEKNDIAVLIGKKGKIANAIREVVSIAGRLDDKRVFVKFESFEDAKEN
ncbi:MAG: KH domain-containing protein [Bacilli bacterium]|jgi:predicted RNA-binding protein YlqC (UPF0109 family)